MSTTSSKDALAASNEAALDLIKVIHEQILDATKSYVSGITEASPDQPGRTDPEPAESIDPKDLIEETFKFQSQLLEATRAFALPLTETGGTWEQPPPADAAKQ